MRKVEETKIQAMEDAAGVVVTTVAIDKVARAVVAAVEARARMDEMTARSGY